MIEQEAIERLLRNIVGELFAESCFQPSQIVSWAGELGLDIQDIATLMRVASGEASKTIVEPAVRIAPVSSTPRWRGGL